MEKSKVIIISDLHMGGKSSPDDFITEKSSSLFSFFLDYLLGRGDVAKVIFNGDIFEMWQFDIDVILEKYRGILKQMKGVSEEGIEFIYIPGNHDAALMGLYKKYKHELGGLKLSKYLLEIKIRNSTMFFSYYTDGYIWVEHGHRFDDYNKAGDESMGKYIAKTIGFFENIHPDVDKWAESTWRSAETIFYEMMDFFKNGMSNTPSKVKGDSEKIQVKEYYKMKAFEFLTKKGKEKIMVVGHTHRKDHARCGEYIYVNSGSWISDDVSFCVYDENSRKIGLYIFDRDNKEFIHLDGDKVI